MTWLRSLRTGGVIAVSCFLSAIATDSKLLAQPETDHPSVGANPVAALSLEQLSATRERPLFSPSRRAPRPAVAVSVHTPVVEAPAPPPNIKLYGTVVDGDAVLAIVFNFLTNQTRRMHIGDDFEGWKVEEIDTRKVVLSRENRSAVFSMFADKNGHKNENFQLAGKTSSGTNQPQ